MKINIEKKILTEALQLIVNISSKSTNEPIINNVLIEAIQNDSDQYIQLSGTDFKVNCRGKFEAEVIEAGSICVNTAKLNNLVKELNSETIHISSTEQNWIYIEGGNSKIKLPGIESGLFPPIEFEELPYKFKIPTVEFKRVVDRIFFAIGENEARKNLMGLNLKIISGNIIRWLGADGYRISQILTSPLEDLNFDGNIIIPKKSLTEIRKILDHTDQEIELSFNDNIFQLTDGESIFFNTKLIEADYPELDNIIINSGEFVAEVSRRELINAVRIISLINEDQTSSMKLSFKKNEIFIESEKLEYGEGNNTVACDFSGDELQVGFNIKYFLEALRSFDSSKSENILIHFMGPLSPCMFQCAEWDEYKTVLMPMKIAW